MSGTSAAADATAGTATGAAAGTDRRPLATRFALFAECLLAGVWLLLAALALVTALPAFAAEWAAAVRTGWRFSLLWWAALALLAFDLRVVSSGLLPGGPAVPRPGLAHRVPARRHPEVDRARRTRRGPTATTALYGPAAIRNPALAGDLLAG